LPNHPLGEVSRVLELANNIEASLRFVLSPIRSDVRLNAHGVGKKSATATIEGYSRVYKVEVISTLEIVVRQDVAKRSAPGEAASAIGFLFRRR
jgi:hypothetical protein